MKKTIIATILVTILVTSGSVFITNAHEPGDPFLKGSGKLIHAVRDYQHSISGGGYHNFEGEW